MRDTPPSMLSELGGWNNGGGVDLETWTSCCGSFRLAVGYAEWFWPEFQEIDGYITRAGATRESLAAWESNRDDRSAVEKVMNHRHLIDLNYSDHENLAADLLVRLGTILKEIHEVKLAWQFPNHPCRVEFHIPEDPLAFSVYQLTFWQVAHEPPAGGA